MASASYPQTAFNSVNRKKQRGHYDYETIHDIINTTSVLHVSFLPTPEDRNAAPIILPMIGQIGQYPSGNDDAPYSCYLHGYVSSRLMRLAPTAVDTGQCDPAGLPVCVAATKVDGFVFALTPFSHSYNYRSAVLQGTATIVEDDDEKMWALKIITDKMVPGRWDGSRVPPDRAEIQSTRVLKVKIETASAKVRAQVPADERKDMKKEDVLDRVWTGVVPVHETIGEPVPSPYNRVQKVPEYMARYIKKENETRQKYALEAAAKSPPAKKKHDE